MLYYRLKVGIMNKFKLKMEQFMRGRYGVDEFSRDLLYIALGLTILNLFIRNRFLNLLPLLAFIFIYVRMFSKNYKRRYNENRVYTNFKYKMTKPFTKKWRKLKLKRKYKILKCPNCKQKLRVPRGKKEIVVTCAKCKFVFDAKS